MWFEDRPEPAPECRLHGNHAAWDAPNLDGLTEVTWIDASGNTFTKTVTCGACGTLVSLELGRDSYTSKVDGRVRHVEWHHRQDWLATFGAKAQLYANAGMSFLEALEAERSDTPPDAKALQVLASLRSPIAVTS